MAKYKVTKANDVHHKRPKEYHHDLTVPLAMYHGLRDLDSLEPELCPKVDVLMHVLQNLRAKVGSRAGPSEYERAPPSISTMSLNSKQYF